MDFDFLILIVLAALQCWPWFAFGIAAAFVVGAVLGSTKSSSTKTRVLSVLTGLVLYSGGFMLLTDSKVSFGPHVGAPSWVVAGELTVVMVISLILGFRCFRKNINERSSEEMP